jgi:hypothetical protein
MNFIKTSDLREHTVRYWAGFVHARGEIDVARVHAFQDLLRKYENRLDSLTDNDISIAYGSQGWVPTPSCCECGVREDTNIKFGLPTTGGDLISLCSGCIQKANEMLTSATVTPKRSIFSFFKGN